MDEVVTKSFITNVYDEIHFLSPDIHDVSDHVVTNSFITDEIETKILF